LEFPADKMNILGYAKESRPSEVIVSLQKIEEKQYDTISDVTKAAGLVRK
jgi:hypothetical protein